jgi:hypothetical protein
MLEASFMHLLASAPLLLVWLFSVYYHCRRKGLPVLLPHFPFRHGSRRQSLEGLRGDRTKWGLHRMQEAITRRDNFTTPWDLKKTELRSDPIPFRPRLAHGVTTHCSQDAWKRGSPNPPCNPTTVGCYHHVWNKTLRQMHIWASRPGEVIPFVGSPPPWRGVWATIPLLPNEASGEDSNSR